MILPSLPTTTKGRRGQGRMPHNLSLFVIPAADLQERDRAGFFTPRQHLVRLVPHGVSQTGPSSH